MDGMGTNSAFWHIYMMWRNIRSQPPIPMGLREDYSHFSWTLSVWLKARGGGGAPVPLFIFTTSLLGFSLSPNQKPPSPMVSAVPYFWFSPTRELAVVPFSSSVTWLVWWMGIIILFPCLATSWFVCLIWFNHHPLCGVLPWALDTLHYTWFYNNLKTLYFSYNLVKI